MDGQPIRVIVADDHVRAREGIRSILQMDSEFEIVAEGTNGREAVELTGVWMPDLLLMDINMPEMNGLEATKRIKEKYPYVKIIIVTVSDDVADLFEAVKKGAQGYLLKNISPHSWIEYLKAVAGDEAPMSREFAVRLLREFSVKEHKASPKNGLTVREQDILELVAKGLSNREIADRLELSEHTVKNHLKNIMCKLHMENRVQLTRYVYEQEMGWH
ncbi:response regulator [Paenibacillus hamazuiensis]|uniref:response regulator n=1 Tax=Paenibacillus hamazuiensis TaxID=2936508 RepID=UPI0020108CDF|nr:response regulator transcription factor [Paenibacillus hamazuiensis]